ncbi:MAG: bifunctional adenosylcobinamide kinase/adenosylcobinamide-phosphate guanylyltransferase [Deltaproteobacteria bacterium]|nr:bifunctional adenosylcobinamide kinase/adenosylcobinamide-phosphate guanylyltransferase [Deltaproteobacteria bacterium]
MVYVVLVTGGCRSGKSAYALRYAEAVEGPRAFVATCSPSDEEMKERIRRHRQARERGNWVTIEAPILLAEAVRGAGRFKALVIDCLTLWINNLLFEASQKSQPLSEDSVAALCEELIEEISRFDGTVILVSNEVGMGIVPADAMSRLYRDLVGCCNKKIADAADEVTLVVSGQPLTIKKRSHS